MCYRSDMCTYYVVRCVVQTDPLFIIKWFFLQDQFSGKISSFGAKKHFSFSTLMSWLMHHKIYNTLNWYKIGQMHIMFWCIWFKLWLLVKWLNVDTTQYLSNIVKLYQYSFFYFIFSLVLCMHFVIFFFRNYLLELCVATTKINVTDFITICYKTEI